MGAMCGAVLPYPLTAKRDFAEHALAAASPCIPPWSATGRVRANAAAFAVLAESAQPLGATSAAAWLADRAAALAARSVA